VVLHVVFVVERLHYFDFDDGFVGGFGDVGFVLLDRVRDRYYVMCEVLCY